jgi:formate-dependent nitrite reductase cytochrome c552 subunit
MKVRELIELLAAQDPEAEVWAEGCDCTNPATGVEYYAPGEYVEISI